MSRALELAIALGVYSGDWEDDIFTAKFERALSRFYDAARSDQARIDATLARQTCFRVNMENAGAFAAVTEHAILAQLEEDWAKRASPC